MSVLWEERLARHGGNINAAASGIVEDLMRGDPVTFKAGYTLENALLAVQDLAGATAFTPDMLAAITAEVEARRVRGGWPCGCGATTVSECTAAVEGHFTSLTQRSDEQLRSLADDDECQAARVLLAARQIVHRLDAEDPA